MGINKPKMPTLGRSRDVKQRLWANLAATAGTQKQRGNVRVSVHFLDLSSTSLGELESLSPHRHASAAIKAPVC